MQTKVCSDCKESKILDDFHKQPSGKFGRHSYCKLCYSKKYRGRIRNDSPTKRRNRNFLTRYDLTTEQVQEMIDAQNGLCAICERILKNPRVDHSHVTNKVRGILCGFCNPAITILENPKMRARAIAYMERD